MQLNLNPNYQNFFEIGLAILGGIIATWVCMWIFSLIDKRLAKSKHIWSHALVRSISKPLLVMIWLMVVSMIIPIVLRYYVVSTQINAYFNYVRAVVFVITVAWAFMRYINSVESRYQREISAGKKKQDKTTLRAITQLFRIAIVIVTLLVLMQTVGIKINSLLAFGGIGTLAVGFAAKDTLANFIGGLMIYWDRPFSVGEWVRSPDRNIEGTVENIGWRLTRIRTFDKRPLYVPNAAFSTISIENPGRMTNRRIKTKIGLRYSDAPKIKAVIDDIENMLQNHPDIDTTMILMVKLIEFGPSALEFLVYTFTKTTKWVEFQTIQQDVFLKIIDIIAQHGAECAFPSRSIYFPEPLMTQRSDAGAQA